MTKTEHTALTEFIDAHSPVLTVTDGSRRVSAYYGEIEPEWDDDEELDWTEMNRLERFADEMREASADAAYYAAKYSQQSFLREVIGERALAELTADDAA